MIALTEAEICFEHGEKLNQSIGSVMHGILMEQALPSWADAMHVEQVRPYSHYLTVEDNRILWRIATLTDEAFEHLALPLMTCTTLHSTQRGEDILVKSITIKERTHFQNLAEQSWNEERRIHHIDLDFLTSTSFRMGDQYAVFPEPQQLFKNLIRKWNRFTDGVTLDDPALANNLANQLRITDYRMHMHPYSLEGTRIPAFRGHLRLGMFQNDTASRMMAMLLRFAMYSGMGMKTALGMGGVKTYIEFWKEKED